MAADRLKVVGIYAEGLVHEKYGRYADDTRYYGAHTMSIVTIEALDPSSILFIKSE